MWRPATWTSLLIALACLPVLVVGAMAAHNRSVWWTPDLLETLMATDSAARGLQALGPWSRIGVFHPGPAWFYWAAPFLKATGGPWGLVLAASALTAASAAAVVVVTQRSGGLHQATAATAVLIFGTLQLSTLGLSAPWNPTVLILPVTCGIVGLAALWRTGTVGLLLLVTACGSLVAQSHFAAVPLGALFLIGGVVGCVVTRRRQRLPFKPLAVIIVAAWIVGPWAPVLYDAAAGTGNAGATVEYVAKGTVRGEPARHDMGISRALSLPGSLAEAASVTFLAEPRTALWAGVDLPAGQHHRTSRRSLAAAVLCVGASVASAVRRSVGQPPLGVVVSRVGLVALIIQTAMAVHLRSEYRPYLIAGASGVGLALWIGVALWAIELLSERGRSLPRWGSRGAAALSLGLLLIAAAAIPRMDQTVEAGSPMPGDRAAVERIRSVATDDQVRFRLDRPWPIVLPSVTLTWELERSGLRVAVRGVAATHMGDAQRNAPWRGTRLVLHPIGTPPPAGCEPVTDYRTLSVCVPD